MLFYRFGFGRFTTEEEVEYAAEKCIKHVERLREMRLVFQIITLYDFQFNNYFIYILVHCGKCIKMVLT